MIVETNISYGYLDLIKIFLDANNLDIKIQDKSAYPFGKIVFEYDEDSEVATTITFMSYRHLGFENMLCDYLIKCGIDPSIISIGSAKPKRDMNKLEEEWQEHRKSIGLG